MNRDWGKALIEAGLDIPNDRVQFNISCPLHGPDKHPSLSINLEVGKWICHAGCGSGSIATLLSEYLNISLLSAEKLAFDDSIKEVDFFTEIVEEEKGLLPQLDIMYDSSSVPDWIFDRGFTKDSLKRWRCGINKDHGSLIIPVTDEHNRDIGWIERHNPQSNFRYQYSKGLAKSQILFGLSKFYENSVYLETPFLCVTEGALDCMWLDQHGFTSVALLGVFLSGRQKDLFKQTNIGEIVLCLDNDVAGKKATEYIRRELGRYAVISHITLEDSFKDVQDIRDSEKLKNMIDDRTVI